MSSTWDLHETDDAAAIGFPAEEWATRTGVDVRPLRDRAERNAKGVDESPGGNTALTRSVPLGTDGPTSALTTRATPPGDALMRIELFWPDGSR